MEAAFEAVTTACIISVEMHQSASRSAIELIQKQDQAVSRQRSTFLFSDNAFLNDRVYRG